MEIGAVPCTMATDAEPLFAPLQFTLERIEAVATGDGALATFTLDR